MMMLLGMYYFYYTQTLYFPQVLRKNFRDLMYVCTFGEDDTSEKRVVYTDNDDDNMLLMVRKPLD